jgi:hypothetical protein
MDLQEASEIRELFLSKAPKGYYLTSPNITYNGIIHGGEKLFDGESGNATMVASLLIKAIDGGKVSVTLFQGDNSYEFLDSPELCKELIQRFTPDFHPRLAESYQENIR